MVQFSFEQEYFSKRWILPHSEGPIHFVGGPFILLMLPSYRVSQKDKSLKSYHMWRKIFQSMLSRVITRYDVTYIYHMYITLKCTNTNEAFTDNGALRPLILVVNRRSYRARRCKRERAVRRKHRHRWQETTESGLQLPNSFHRRNKGRTLHLNKGLTSYQRKQSARPQWPWSKHFSGRWRNRPELPGMGLDQARTESRGARRPADQPPLRPWIGESSLRLTFSTICHFPKIMT